jgi:hypothetical protein
VNYVIIEIKVLWTKKKGLACQGLLGANKGNLPEIVAWQRYDLLWLIASFFWVLYHYTP